MCPSSRETTVFMRHLVVVILRGWLSGMQGGIHSTLHIIQEKQLYLYDTWYLLFFMGDCMVCRVEYIPPCIPYRITSTKCRINTVVSPGDEHIDARNMYRKEINILRKIVHQVGFIYKILQDARSTKHQIYLWRFQKLILSKFGGK